MDMDVEDQAEAPTTATPYPAPDLRASWADRKDTNADTLKYRLYNQECLGL